MSGPGLTRPPARPTEGALRGELLEPLSALTVVAFEVAARQAAPATRATYASVYRAFAAFLGPDATAADVTPQAVRAWRDRLEADGRSPATTAKHLSALRKLAMALGSDTAIAQVRSGSVARGEPRALTAEELERLLRMPDRRTTQGKRDLALLHLLARAGLRRGEAAALQLGDVDERRRAVDGRLRAAVAGSTSWWATVTYGKRGRNRAIPLEEEALTAIVAWVRARPAAATAHLLLSLPRTGRPAAALSTRDVARVVERHAAAAGLPEDRRSPHVLRHTFCTHLADADVPVEVIGELAGHADIRTTMIYTQINDQRLEHHVATAAAQRTGIGRLAALTS